MSDTARWWQRGIIYQVYPRSFQDSNGDGIGDLPGVTARLDYLRWLGVDAVWLSPIFPSPMADFGYDVSDYVGIDPAFGTLDDFDALVAAAHARDMKIILDYVPNHSSKQHPWFVESRSSRQNPKRDWYIWRDPAPDGGPPTNWLSEFGGPAWTYDALTGQFYYHAYLPEQPDLNWGNPAVRQTMLDVIRFWFERGVDGFRIDALRQIVKDEQFRDNPLNTDWREGDNPAQRVYGLYTADTPGVQEMTRLMRQVSDAYDERVLIGELYLPLERLVTYYAAGIQLPFNFHLLKTAWNARAIEQLITRYESLIPIGEWPNWVLGNHDNHRIASRVGPDQARVAALLLLTLRGTPTLYYGDELGMHDLPIPPELVQDPWEKRVPGLGFGRDPERTPMQWDASAGAGFTSGTPWLPLGTDYQQRNVARQQDDPRSMLMLYKRLIDLRRHSSALALGDYLPLTAEGDLLAYARRAAQQQVLVALNLGAAPATLQLEGRRGRVLISTHLDREGDAAQGRLELRGDEALVLELDP
jgi:alpha-glucosidase